MRGNQIHKALDRHLGRLGIVALSLVGSRRLADPARVEPAAVLVVKLSAMGDTILLGPALREIRRRWPAARVGMLGTAVNRGIAAEMPAWIDRFFCLDPGRALREPGYAAAFVRELRAERWDVGIDFDQWTHVTPLLLRLSGAPVRVGFRTRFAGRHRLYTHTRDRDPTRHEAENFLRLLEPLGLTPPPPRLELPVRPEAAARMRDVLGRAGWDGRAPLVVVHAGCGHAHARAWPLERYRQLCARVAERAPAFFVFTGAGDEAEGARALAASLPGRTAAPTDTTIAEFVATISLSDLVVSGNTGAMHVAAALGRGQVVLEGPNDPAKWGPLNPRAEIVRSSCPECPCLDMGWEFHRTDGFCMEQIGVDEVLARVLSALDPARGRELTFPGASQ